MLYARDGSSTFLNFGQIVYEDTSQVIQEMEGKSNTSMDAMHKGLNDDGMRSSFLIHSRPVADAILAIADAMQADIITLSTHGRSGVLRWVLGSYATDCPAPHHRSPMRPTNQ